MLVVYFGKVFGYSICWCSYGWHNIWKHSLSAHVFSFLSRCNIFSILLVKPQCWIIFCYFRLIQLFFNFLYIAFLWQYCKSWTLIKWMSFSGFFLFIYTNTFLCGFERLFIRPFIINYSFIIKITIENETQGSGDYLIV